MSDEGKFNLIMNGFGPLPITIKGVSEATTILELKQIIQLQEGPPVEGQNITFAGKPLRETAPNGQTCTVKTPYKMKADSVIFMTYRLEGGLKEVEVVLNNQKKVKLTFDESSTETVAAFKIRVATEGAKNACSLSADAMRLEFGGAEMKDTKLLKEIFGGFDGALSCMQSKGRLQEGAHPGLVLSYDNCLFEAGDLDSDDEDDDDTPGEREANAKMPCGHVIGVAGMTGFVKSLLDKQKIYQILCPGKKADGQNCEQPWDYDLCRAVGTFTPEECKEFEAKLGRNYAQTELKMDYCPKCNTSLTRKDDKELMTACYYCAMKGQAFKFCWICKREYKGSDRYKCGYGEEACSGKASLWEVLASCAVAPKFGIEDVPTIRACPSCNSANLHPSGCKHMTCYNCSHEYCHVCLRDHKVCKADTPYNYFGKCASAPLAPRQTKPTQS